MDTKEHSRRHFDRWAPRYERDRASRRLAEIQEAALELLDLRADDRLLDVGCGTGAAVRQAAPRVSRAVGVDLSEAMIERARELAAGMHGVEFRVGDSEDLPLEDGEFTALLCTTSFHHYPNPQQAAREMARVLAPAGRLVLGDATADHLGVRVIDRLLRIFQPSHVGLYRRHELDGFLASAGLRTERRELLWRGAYALTRAGVKSSP